MTLQWLRSGKLEIAGESFPMGGPNDPRVRFLCRQWKTQSPAPGEFRIYNISKDHARSLVTGSEGKTVTLTVGYQGNPGVIYKGEIRKAQSGRENPVDTFVDFFCQGVDRGYNHGVINKTFAAGSKQEDHVKEVLNVLKPYGVTRGTIEGLSQVPYPRAVSLYGMVRDFMRTIAISNNAQWWINPRDLTLNHVPTASEGQGGDFNLNEQTGLIGMPVQLQDGSIIVTALINPQFDIHKRLIIDESKIQRASWSVNWGDQANQEFSRNTVSGVADGVYTIWDIEWRGDSRGQEWYATMICTGSLTGQQPGGTLGTINPPTLTTNHGSQGQ